MFQSAVSGDLAVWVMVGYVLVAGCFVLIFRSRPRLNVSDTLQIASAAYVCVCVECSKAVLALTLFAS